MHWMCLIKSNSCSEAILYFKTKENLWNMSSFILDWRWKALIPQEFFCLYSWMWVVKQEHNTAQFNTKIVVSKTLTEDLSRFWGICSPVLRSLSGSVGKELPLCCGSFEILGALCERLWICVAKVQPRQKPGKSLVFLQSSAKPPLIKDFAQPFVWVILSMETVFVEIGQEMAGWEGMLLSSEIPSNLVCCHNLFQTFCHGTAMVKISQVTSKGSTLSPGLRAAMSCVNTVVSVAWTQPIHTMPLVSHKWCQCEKKNG